MLIHVTIGTSIVLIAVGAILKYAVTAETDFIDLQTTGVVLMLVGILGLILSLLYTFMWSPQAQARARRDERDPRDPRDSPTRRY
jgi:heme/copper-type cytochrome/quinol oxidase subunit 2